MYTVCTNIFISYTRLAYFLLRVLLVCIRTQVFANTYIRLQFVLLA